MMTLNRYQQYFHLNILPLITSDKDFIIEIIKLAVPAIGAWYIAHLRDKKNNREWQEKKQDQLTAGLFEMTTQSRDMVYTLQTENSTLRSNLKSESERADKAEKEAIILREELSELKRKRDNTPKRR